MAGRPGAAGEFLGDPGWLGVAARSAPADLEDAGAQLAEHAADRVALLLRGH